MTIKKLVLCAFLSFVILFPLISLAADPIPVNNLNYAPPCVASHGILGLDTCASPLTVNSTIQDYLIRLYQFAVGISGIVAVGMIVWGSIQISLFSESITSKSEGREKIISAIIGIVLLLGSYLILSTVNPRIVSLSEMLSTSTVPANTSTPTALPKPPEACADPATIRGDGNTVITNVQPNEPLTSSDSCKYRKLYIYTGGLTISVSNSNYYSGVGGISDTTIAPKSVIWTYPYIITGQGPSSARCLIYAYKEPGASGAKYVGLQKTIEPCVLTGTSTQQAGYTGDAAGGGGTTVPPEIKTLANEATGGNINYSGSGDCKPQADTNAGGIISYLQRGDAPYVCYSGCSASSAAACTITGTFPNATILGAIKSLKTFLGTGPITATITSLTGGDHRGGSSHYTGSAFDLKVNSGGVSGYNVVIAKLDEFGVTAHCEYIDASGATQFLTTCGNGAFASGVTNLHIHAQN